VAYSTPLAGIGPPVRLGGGEPEPEESQCGQQAKMASATWEGGVTTIGAHRCLGMMWRKNDAGPAPAHSPARLTIFAYDAKRQGLRPGSGTSGKRATTTTAHMTSMRICSGRMEDDGE